MSDVCVVFVWSLGYLFIQTDLLLFVGFMLKTYFSPPGFWVHCNDSKLRVCSVEEVCRAQAYILFYTQRVTQDKDRPL